MPDSRDVKRAVEHRQQRDETISDVAFAVSVEAPIPARYRKLAAAYIRARIGNL